MSSILPQLEEKIYSLVPELKELTFWCEIQSHYETETEWANYIWKYLCSFDDWIKILYNGNSMYVKQYKIIGHEIHPHHWLPLLWDMFSLSWEWQILREKYFDISETYQWINYDEEWDELPKYDFKKSFKDQSPEFHEWLLSQLPNS